MPLAPNMIAFWLSPLQWAVVLIIGLLVFGKRLPDLGKSLGRTIFEFKKGLKEAEEEEKKALGGDQADILPPPDKQPGASNQTRPGSDSTGQKQP